jgi:CheY-like chemotaxis protein
MEMLKEIRRAAQDATQVVKNLRSFYAPAANETYERLDLNKLATEAIALTRPKWKEEMSAKGVTISMETDFCGMPAIKGNAPQLRTALTNLIFNSIEAMPQGGVITISTREGRPYHSIEVRDSGVGMTEDVRKQCFEPFFTTRGQHGSGLGLSMAYGIVQRHGGGIEAESRPGHGTLMRIRLPARAAAGKVEQVGPEQGAGTVHLRVLVVDDEETCLNVIGHYLHADGHSFELARSGKEALEKFRSGGFDVVLTDRAMPGMSGDRVAAEIRRASPGTPVIMITGFGNAMIEAKNYPEGVDLVLSKPLTLDELRRVLANLRL